MAQSFSHRAGLVLAWSAWIKRWERQYGSIIAEPIPPEVYLSLS